MYQKMQRLQFLAGASRDKAGRARGERVNLEKWANARESRASRRRHLRLCDGRLPKLFRSGRKFCSSLPGFSGRKGRKKGNSASHVIDEIDVTRCRVSRDDERLLRYRASLALFSIRSRALIPSRNNPRSQIDSTLILSLIDA